LLIITTCQTALGEPLAGESPDLLAMAEEAYQQVDFDRVYAEAQRSLALGHPNARITARLHVLLGISAAALGKESESRDHFVAALAISPALRLEQTLSPKLRGPYLEARGFWLAHPDRLSVKAAVDRPSGQLTIWLEDPAHLTQTVRLYLRKDGDASFTQLAFKARAIIQIPIPPKLLRSGFEYYSQALDGQNNVVYEQANATAAVALLGERTASLKSRRPEPPRLPLGTTATTTWVPPAMALGGLAAAGAGAFFNYRREVLADRWNSPSCEQPGQTRSSQCAGLNADRKLAERLALGLYAGGGLLVTGSTILWLLNRASNSAQEPPQQASLGPACQVIAWDGLGAACAGSF
jgi:hypothetical protein